MSKVNLETFAGGALQEKFNDAMKKVLENLMDPNTPWKIKRKIGIEVSFEQNEDRDDASVNVSVVTKLAPVKPIGTRMSIGKDLDTKEVFAEEYGSQCRGQMTIGDCLRQQEQEIEGQTVDTETGEIKESSNVIDLRQTKQA